MHSNNRNGYEIIWSGSEEEARARRRRKSRRIQAVIVVTGIGLVVCIAMVTFLSLTADSNGSGDTAKQTVNTQQAEAAYSSENTLNQAASSQNVNTNEGQMANKIQEQMANTNEGQMHMQDEIAKGNQVTMQLNDDCPVAPEITDFKAEAFTGIWYEIAKIQTSGAAVFQAGCRCTTFEFVPSGPVKDNLVNGTSIFSCYDNRLAGSLISVNGSMTSTNQPASWVQNLFGSKINWNVIIQEEEYLVSYDCTQAGATYEYCVHILSRSPTFNENTLQQIQQYANNNQLNPQNIGLDRIDQDQSKCAQL